MRQTILLFVVFLISVCASGQNVIWSEYFDVYPNNTMLGPGFKESNYKWKIQSGRRVSSSASVQNGKMRFKRYYNSNYIETAKIDISQFRNVSISIKYSASGNGKFKNNSLIDYWLDGNWYRIKQVNDANTQTLTASNLNGSELNIRCTINLRDSKYEIYIDEIVISGEYKGSESNNDGDGQLKAEYYEGISGSNLSNLKNNGNYPNNPSSTQFLTSFDAPQNRGSNFGGRLSGYIVAPKTGYYNFFIASDDHSEFRISPDDNAGNLPNDKDAYVTAWAGYHNYWDGDCKHSGNKFLVKGRMYYFEGIYKEGGGGDHMTIAWLKPGSTNLEIIPSSVLSSTKVKPLVISATGTNLKCNNDNSGKIVVSVTGGTTPYQYSIDGTNFQSSNTFNGLNAGSYNVKVKDSGNREKSTSVTLVEPSPLTLNLTALQPDCGDCNGRAQVQIAGGTAPYQLNWSGAGFSGVGTKKVITFQGHDETNDYQLELTVAYESNMQSDFDDLRFFDEDGNSIPYWVEKYIASSSVTVWVKVPEVKSGLNSIEMRYGDATAVSQSNIENVLISGGLNIEYYTNASLSGTPERCIDTKVLDYAYGEGANVPIGNCSSVRGDYLSVRWTGWIKNPSSSNSLYWNANTDDGFRIYMDNTKIYDHWVPQSPKVFSINYTFPTERNIVRFKYEFFENSGNAYARLGYSNNNLGSNNEYNIGTKVPNSHYYYRNILGNPPTDIAFGEESGTNFVKEGMCKGTHTLTITDANNCTVSQTITITEVTVTLQLQNFDGCTRPGSFGDDVKAIATPAGGSGNYQYQFLYDGNIIQAFGASNECLMNNHISKGNHVVEVIVKDLSNSGCEASKSKSITVHDQIQTNSIGLDNN
ncbi:DUF2341 domain-containing protein [Prolixibacteraceae bacterium JC049]|nr:DUF2341 domain-containing protein [Prolixibacteraceae bacterium JC049]